MSVCGVFFGSLKVSKIDMIETVGSNYRQELSKFAIYHSASCNPHVPDLPQLQFLESTSS